MTWIIVPMSECYVNGFRAALGSVAREGKYLALQDAPPLINVVHFVDMLAKAGCPQLLAVDGTKVVGWCDLRPRENASESHIGELGMGVIASHRRQGIGRALLEACLATSPFARVELSVFASNPTAIALYETGGFAREGVRLKALKLGDRYEDVVMMARIDTAKL